MVFCPFHRVPRVVVALTVAHSSSDDGETLHTLGRTRVFTDEGLETVHTSPRPSHSRTLRPSALGADAPEEKYWFKNVPQDDESKFTYLLARLSVGPLPSHTEWIPDRIL